MSTSPEKFAVVAIKHSHGYETHEALVSSTQAVLEDALYLGEVEVTDIEADLRTALGVLNNCDHPNAKEVAARLRKILFPS